MTVPSLLILGTDAVLTAAPATPVQLAHACLAAGYHAVIPASWGDELIASRAIARLREADGPLLQCSCPHVARRIAAHGDSLAPFVLPFVAPPVATAQYLRAAYAPVRPQITFAGDCPSGSHQSIDFWLTALELAAMLAGRGIVTGAQPTEFDSVLPPDRRRFFSEPGGVPSRSTLRHLPTPVDLVELKGDDIVVELAQQLLAGSPALVDLATSVGCSCSGAVGSVNVETARARVREHEPPRALAPVVDHSVSLALEGTAPRLLPVASVTRETAAPPHQPTKGGDVAAPDAEPVAVEAIARRRSTPGQNRAVLGVMPHSRLEAGRQLPRAYIARRRSSPQGILKSSIRGADATPPARRDRRSLWILGGTVGVAIGLGIAWLLRAVL